MLLTVNVNDIKDEKVSLDDRKFTFSGVGEADEQRFACELEFLEEVVPQVCIWQGSLSKLTGAL